MSRVLNTKPPNIKDSMYCTPQCKERFYSWGTDPTDHHIAEAGIDILYPGYSLGRPNPRFHLILYTIEGEGEVYTPDHVRVVSHGDLLVIPAGVTFGYIPHEQPWNLMWVHLPNESCWGQVRGDDITVRPTVLTPFLERPMEGFFAEIRRHGQTSKRASALHTELISVYIERELGRERLLSEEPIQEQLDSLWDAVREDLAFQWDIDELAREMGMSPHLFRIVKSLTGMTPMQKVTQLRMDYAQEWLMLYNQPIRIIAEKVGYVSEFSFSNAFKRFSGDSPGKFRKRR
jgi:AraC-like DNA-binding protein